MTNRPGAARDLPSLQGFEDADDEPDMGSLLKRRRPATGSEEPLEPATTQVSNQTRAPVTPASSASERDVAPLPPRPKRKRATGNQPGASVGGPGAPVPAHGEGDPYKIRSSSVHVPAPLLEKVVAYRHAHGLSNGNIVITALEEALPRLAELIKPPPRTGGRLFRERASYSARTTTAPLSPLNVRLSEEDFTRLDKLVDKHKASSRGRLVTAVLSDFLDN